MWTGVICYYEWFVNRGRMGLVGGRFEGGVFWVIVVSRR